MPTRQNNLRDILGTTGRITKNSIPMPTFQDLLKSPQYTDIRNVYASLSGTAFHSLESGDIIVRPGNGHWDIEIDDIAVEIDEERHANYDRLVTFNSPLYEGQVWVKSYKEYCSIYEDACFKAASYGRNWSSPNSYRQFTPLSTERYTRPFSPRWKQRAFYDYLKDLSAHYMKLKLARIAIYDRISITGVEHSVEEILCDRRIDAAMELRHFIEGRIM